MSKFSTVIPCEAASFIKSLPKRATFTGITLNPDTHEVVVLWEDEDVYTGLTVQTDYPLELFKKGKLPKTACKASERPKAPVLPKEKQNVPQPKPEAKVTLPVYLSEQQVNDMASKGQEIEYQGILPKWVTFNPRVDKFTEGYFYRPKAKVVDTPLAVA